MSACFHIENATLIQDANKLHWRT